MCVIVLVGQIRMDNHNTTSAHCVGRSNEGGQPQHYERPLCWPVKWRWTTTTLWAPTVLAGQMKVDSHNTTSAHCVGRSNDGGQPQHYERPLCWPVKWRWTTGGKGSVCWPPASDAGMRCSPWSCSETLNKRWNWIKPTWTVKYFFTIALRVIQIEFSIACLKFK